MRFCERVANLMKVFDKPFFKKVSVSKVEVA